MSLQWSGAITRGQRAGHLSLLPGSRLLSGHRSNRETCKSISGACFFFFSGNRYDKLNGMQALPHCRWGKEICGISGTKRKKAAGQTLPSISLTIRALRQRLPKNNSICFSGERLAHLNRLFLPLHLYQILLFSVISRLREYKDLPLHTFAHSRKALSLLRLCLLPLFNLPADTLLQLWVSRDKVWVRKCDTLGIAAPGAGIRSPAYAQNKNSSSKTESSKEKSLSLSLSPEVVNDIEEGRDPSSPLSQAAD